MAMSIQIEVTTRCNYGCFYCAGRSMPQEDMPFDRFAAILDKTPPGRHLVSLQGEGEPTNHPRFWDMVDAVLAAGHVPYVITNGSHLDVAAAAMRFGSIGVSIDTLDPVEAERIGRYKLPRVLATLDALVDTMGPERVVVHTVDYGQPLAALEAHVRARGIDRHVVQPLQIKDDYARRYPELVPLRRAKDARASRATYCAYVYAYPQRYYDVRGVEMPCCFIKDTSAFTSIEALRASLDAGVVPGSCTGCRELRERA